MRGVSPETASANLIDTSALTLSDWKGVLVEIKIGVTDSPRELVISSDQTPADVEKVVSAALSKESDVLNLTDQKGRKYLISAARIAYVEIGVADARRVGFSS